MADYIDRNILCQAYVHIEPVGLNDDDQEILKDQINHFIEARGKHFLYSEIESNVEFKEGSLRVYATIAGLLYLAIGQYGSFRSGVDYITTDVKRLSESIINESLFLSRSQRDQIIRVEARVGVVGSLKKIIDEIEFIERNMGEQGVISLAKRLRRVRVDTTKLLRNIKNEKDVRYVKKNLLEVVNETLPQNPVTPAKKSTDREADAIYRDERKLIMEMLEKVDKPKNKE